MELAVLYQEGPSAARLGFHRGFHRLAGTGRIGARFIPETVPGEGFPRTACQDATGSQVFTNQLFITPILVTQTFFARGDRTFS